MKLLSLTLEKEQLPKHVGIIMDGNGRWASAQGLLRAEGHKAGTRTAYTIADACYTAGIKYLSLYAFSQENWSRPKEEVNFLFGLFVEFLTKWMPDLQRKGARFKVLGEWQALPFPVRQTLEHAMRSTEKNTAWTLNLAINYSGREEIVRACKALITQGVQAEAVTAALLAEQMYTAGQPDPDLIIRTSGELRTSNFFPFQSVYSEYYFTPTFWPDFSVTELHQAFLHYAQRTRRFGSVTDTDNGNL